MDIIIWMIISCMVYFALSRNFMVHKYHYLLLELQRIFYLLIILCLFNIYIDKYQLIDGFYSAVLALLLYIIFVFICVTPLIFISMSGVTLPCFCVDI